MANKIVRYLLEGAGNVPNFIDNGGYFPLGNELVGRSVDEDTRYIPSTVVRMSKADLLARVTLMLKDDNGNFREKRKAGQHYSSQDAQDMVQEFLDSIGMSNYP